MVFTLPSVSVTFGSRSKDEPEKKTAAAETSATHVSSSFDPVMAMMLVAIVLLSSAILVYAARS
jgi:hypothetical protein